MNKYIVIVVGVLFLALGAAFLMDNREPKVSIYDGFAQCLTEKGVVMYGTYWCSHCLDQKKLFGSSFEYVTYVECSTELDRCNAEKVQATPTWIFGNGEREVGKLSLEKISEISGCVLPTE